MKLRAIDSMRRSLGKVKEMVAPSIGSSPQLRARSANARKIVRPEIPSPVLNGCFLALFKVYEEVSLHKTNPNDWRFEPKRILGHVFDVAVPCEHALGRSEKNARKLLFVRVLRRIRNGADLDEVKCLSRRT
jgi:hypothetical protein